MSELVECPFCCEPVHENARKCKHCQEFISDPRPAVTARSTWLSLLRISLDFIARIAIPAAVLAVILIFKPTLDSLFTRAEEAEFFGSKVKFADAAAYAGYLSAKVNDLALASTPEEIKAAARQIAHVSSTILDLHPVSLYYLIGAAEGGVLHYNLIYEKHRTEIDALVEKGLVRLEIAEGDLFEGAKGIHLDLTSSGTEFLNELGIEVNVGPTAD